MANIYTNEKGKESREKGKWFFAWTEEEQQHLEKENEDEKVYAFEFDGPVVPRWSDLIGYIVLPEISITPFKEVKPVTNPTIK